MRGGGPAAWAPDPPAPPAATGGGTVGLGEAAATGDGDGFGGSMMPPLRVPGPARNQTSSASAARPPSASGTRRPGPSGSPARPATHGNGAVCTNSALPPTRGADIRSPSGMALIV